MRRGYLEWFIAKCTDFEGTPEFTENWDSFCGPYLGMNEEMLARDEMQRANLAAMDSLRNRTIADHQQRLADVESERKERPAECDSQGIKCNIVTSESQIDVGASFGGLIGKIWICQTRYLV